MSQEVFVLQMHKFRLQGPLLHMSTDPRSLLRMSTDPDFLLPPRLPCSCDHSSASIPQCRRMEDPGVGICPHSLYLHSSRLLLLGRAPPLERVISSPLLLTLQTYFITKPAEGRTLDPQVEREITFFQGQDRAALWQLTNSSHSWWGRERPRQS